MGCSEATAAKVLQSIKKLTPDNFEHLVMWYMNKLGATKAYIPAKNESGKSEGTDFAKMIIDIGVNLINEVVGQ